MGNFIFEGTVMFDKHFGGAIDEYNAQGKKFFKILIPEDVATELEANGHNIKRIRDKRNPEGPLLPIAKICISDKTIARGVIYEIHQKNGKPVSKVALDTTARVEALDHLPIEKFKAQVFEGDWEFMGKSGKKLWLSGLGAFIQEDSFSSEWDNIPEIGGNNPEPDNVPDLDLEEIPFV